MRRDEQQHTPRCAQDTGADEVEYAEEEEPLAPGANLFLHLEEAVHRGDSFLVDFLINVWLSFLVVFSERYLGCVSYVLFCGGQYCVARVLFVGRHTVRLCAWL